MEAITVADILVIFYGRSTKHLETNNKNKRNKRNQISEISGSK
jgi:hypothetical protein